MKRPDWRTEIRARLTGLSLTPVREADIIEELSVHLDERFRELCHTHDEDEARRQAVAELDTPGALAERLRTLRQARDAQRTLPPPGVDQPHVLSGLMGDIRYALRTLGRSPGFTATVVATLALGIGANTAIFSVIDSVLLRTTPFADMDRLAMVWETDRDSGTTREPASFPDFLDFQSRSRQMARMAAVMGIEVSATTTDGTPLRLAGLAATHDLLPMLGLRPAVGRTFDAEEDRPGGARVAVISDGLWTRLFARDPEVVGDTIRLDDTPTTIVGVLPEGADLGALQVLSAAAYARAFADRGTQASVDIWVPRQWDAESMPRATHPIFVVGRLAPGATMDSAQTELAEIAADLERAYPENDARGVFVEPFADVIFGPVRPTLWLLAAAVALVLLVSCANVATLLLARATTRIREVALRRAVGASGWHLTRQFLVESLVLTLVSAAVGVGLAAVGLHLLIDIAPSNVPRLSEARLDLRVLSLAVGLSIAVAMVFALIPVTQAWRLDLQAACKGLTCVAPATTRRWMPGQMLVVTQVALAVVLVVGTGLLLRSFWGVLQVDAGFESGGVLKAEYELPSSRYPGSFGDFPNFTEAHGANREILSRLSSTRGVSSAALAGNHPLDAGFTNSFVVVGREAEASDWPEISIRRVTPDYFETVRLDLRAGRVFRESDSTDAPRVGLINQSAVRRYFSDGQPIGHELSFWGSQWRVVGVVADEHTHGLEQPAPPSVYLPLAQAPSMDGVYSLLIRTTSAPATMVSDVTRIVRDVDPALALFGVEPLDATLARSVGQRRFMVTLLTLFAGLAIILAITGVQGVLGHGVAQRRQEIGIRIALGARPSGVAGTVVREGLALTLVGLAIGGAASAGAAYGLSSLLFGISPIDPVTFALVPVAVVVVTLTAAYIPARRAANVDPLLSLKIE